MKVVNSNNIIIDPLDLIPLVGAKVELKSFDGTINIHRRE